MPLRQWDVLRRHRELLKLWSGQTISSFSSAITTLALPLTAARELKAAPVQMGILGAVGYLPHLALGLPAGVWVDRWPRRPILIATDLGRVNASRRFLVFGVIPLGSLAGGALGQALGLRPALFARRGLAGALPGLAGPLAGAHPARDATVPRQRAGDSVTDPSIVKSRLDQGDPVRVHPIDEPVLLIDPPRPRVRPPMSQWLRLTDARVGVA